MITEASSLISQNGGSEKMTVVINATGTIGRQIFGEGSTSAYNLISNPGYRNDVSANITNWTGNGTLGAISQGMYSLLLDGIAVFGIEFGVFYVVTWSDGSTSTFLIDADHIAAAGYVEGSSQDADGNPLPDGNIVENPNSYVGTYNFGSGGRMDQFISLVELYGIPVTMEGSSGGGAVCTVGRNSQGTLEVTCKPG